MVFFSLYSYFYCHFCTLRPILNDTYAKIKVEKDERGNLTGNVEEEYKRTHPHFEEDKKGRKVYISHKNSVAPNRGTDKKK